MPMTSDSMQHLLLSLFLASFFLSTNSVRPLSQISAPPDPTPIARRSLDVDFDIDFNLNDGHNSWHSVPNLDLSSVPIGPVPKVLCSGTDYVNECIISILPLLRERSSGHVEPIDILRMEVRSLSGKANATLAYVKKILADPSTPEAMSELLHSCAESYDSLIDDLNEVWQAIEGGDLGRLENLLNSSITDIATCTDAFSESTHLIVDSPTANQDEYIKKLCSNVLATSQIIQT